MKTQVPPPPNPDKLGAERARLRAERALAKASEKIVATLKPAELDVVTLRSIGRTLKEIGASRGVTEERARQIYVSGLAKLEGEPPPADPFDESLDGPGPPPKPPAVVKPHVTLPPACHLDPPQVSARAKTPAGQTEREKLARVDLENQRGARAAFVPFTPGARHVPAYYRTQRRNPRINADADAADVVHAFGITDPNLAAIVGYAIRAGRKPGEPAAKDLTKILEHAARALEFVELEGLA